MVQYACPVSFYCYYFIVCDFCLGLYKLRLRTHTSVEFQGVALESSFVSHKTLNCTLILILSLGNLFNICSVLKWVFWWWQLVALVWICHIMEWHMTVFVVTSFQLKHLYGVSCHLYDGIICKYKMCKTEQQLWWIRFCLIYFIFICFVVFFFLSLIRICRRTDLCPNNTAIWTEHAFTRHR